MNHEKGIWVRMRVLVASMLACALLTPLAAGCGRSGNDNAGTGTAGSMVRQAPNYGTVPAPRNANNGGQRQGMSTGKKVAILAGAAALLYLYNKHKNAKGSGPEGQYYRSKNGRIYYRDAQGNAVYVTPPAGGIQVPADVAEQYNRAAQSGNFDVNDNYAGSPGRGGAYGY